MSKKTFGQIINTIAVQTDSKVQPLNIDAMNKATTEVVCPDCEWSIAEIDHTAVTFHGARIKQITTEVFSCGDGVVCVECMELDTLLGCGKDVEVEVLRFGYE